MVSIQTLWCLFPERATRLLVDTLVAIHGELIDAALNESTGIDLSQVSPVLDDMADAISEVNVRGTAEEEVSGTGTHKTTSAEEAGVSFTPKTVSVTATTKDMQEQQEQGSYRLKITAHSSIAFILVAWGTCIVPFNEGLEWKKVVDSA